MQELLCLWFFMEFPQSFVELENFDTCPVSCHYHLYHKKVGVKYFKLILFRVTFPSVSVLSKFSIISILLCSVSCSFSNSFFPCQLSNFQDSPCPSTTRVLPPPWPWTSNFKRTPLPPSPNDKQSIKRKHNPRMTIISTWLLSGPFFRSSFVFSINSLTLFGFPLISFHLAQASLSAFSWLYILMCVAVQNYL